MSTKAPLLIGCGETQVIWQHGGEVVQIKGSWDEWTGVIDLEREIDQPNTFSISLILPNGEYTYKYIVDGKWEIDHDSIVHTDPDNNKNNKIFINCFQNSIRLPLIPIPLQMDRSIMDTSTFYSEPCSPITVQNEGSPTLPPTGRQRSSSEVFSEKSLTSPFRFSPGRRRKQMKGYRAYSFSDLSVMENLDLSSKSLLMNKVSVLDKSEQMNVLSSAEAAIKSEGKLIIAMVGLPARGKTFIAQKLSRHMKWMGYKIEVFNVGQQRRKQFGTSHDHKFFDPNNPKGMETRQKLANDALQLLRKRLDTDLDMGVFDATNTTVARRRWLMDEVASWNTGARVMFVESVCKNPEIIEANIRDIKLKSPDYCNMDPEKAMKDFKARIAQYESVYETLTFEENACFVQLIDVGSKVITHKTKGYLPSKIVYFLTNLHIKPPPIFLTRHGESERNAMRKIGSGSMLTVNGDLYSKKLKNFIDERFGPPAEPIAPGTPSSSSSTGSCSLTVWSATLPAPLKTAAELRRTLVTSNQLNGIDTGSVDGWTLGKFAEELPDDYEARYKDPLNVRFPGAGGENYRDVINRLEPTILEIIRQQKPVLVVAHQSTLRVLLAYLSNKEPADCPHLSIPLHTVLEITPTAYGCDQKIFELMSPRSIHSPSPSERNLQAMLDDSS